MAARLQKLKLLSYRRGEISLLDRPGMEALACGCYGIIREELEQILKL